MTFFSKKKVSCLMAAGILFGCLLWAACTITVTGDDGSVWVQVNRDGFGNRDNFSVVAMAAYQDALYAMTRNEDKGAEVWKYDGSDWEQVLFPGGEKNGIYGNENINNVWGRMIVFNSKLYFGFSSGLQGNYLNSTGCEIWRYDGSSWEAVISDERDTDASGTITAISGCAADDGATTAVITDSSQSWTVDEWAGGTLQITSGDGIYRKFYIIGNTADSLTIQQNETAGTGADAASETEYTVCEAAEYNNPYPLYSYTLGEVEEGDTFTIGMGFDESGFGEIWNKTITDMTLYNGNLYVSTGLNYDYGAQIWSSEDGDTWTVTEPANSFGNYHAGTANYPGGEKPVSSSLTSMAVFNDTLYAGGTGTTGLSGSCSRMAILTETGWELIVDSAIDANDNGTNENGFGDGMDCDMDTGNFMPWNLTVFNEKLFAGINSLGGLRILYTTTGTADDDAWSYSVGGDAVLPPGFNDLRSNPTWGHDNIAPNLFEFNNELYAGAVTLYIPEYGATNTNGAHIWKTGNGIDWTRVTGNGFNDNEVIIFEAFAEYDGHLYVSASKGASSTPEGLGGAMVYRLETPGS